jgi:DNA-binding MarR family transcriptional regulator
MTRDAVDVIQEAWERERPDVNSSSIGIITRIWRLSRFLDRERSRTLAALGTDASTLDALATLRRAGPPYRLTAGEMHRRSLVTAGAISQRLDKLETAGLVRRERDNVDRRLINVVLTSQGRRLVDMVFESLMDQELKLLVGFTDEERSALANLLRRWLHRFETDLRNQPAGTADRWKVRSHPETVKRT